MRTIGIGLLGAGNVGSGVVRILRDNRSAIETRLGARLELKRVLVRELGRTRGVELPHDLATTEAAQVIDDPEVEVVVELIGGLEPARTHVLRAIAQGKHVVSANKALLATHGDEILSAAARHGVWVAFEGAVAGGVPILRTLREGLASDQIEAILGIVNGTSNFVLDSMTRAQMSYEQALADAQRQGYAEADPTFDVEGIDAAQKLALLAFVAFGLRVDPEQIVTEGISRVRAFDIVAAGELGCVIKSLALVRRTPEGLVLRVHPTLVPSEHVLAGVHGSYNAIMVRSAALGQSLYYGRGAGMMPTGMAVVSDVIELCRGIVSATETTAASRFVAPTPTTPLALDDEVHANYLCVHVNNKPGVLGQVASSLGRHGVSIKRVKQDPHGPGAPVDMVIVTELARDREVRDALAEVDALPEVLAPTHRFRLLEQDFID